MNILYLYTIDEEKLPEIHVENIPLPTKRASSHHSDEQDDPKKLCIDESSQGSNAVMCMLKDLKKPLSEVLVSKHECQPMV